MQILKISSLISCAFILMGCQTSEPDFPDGSQFPVAQHSASESEMAGTVVSVNEDPRFAVIEFLPGKMPTTNSVVSIFRENIRVGNVRITGPNKAPLATGDIEEGNAETGDEVKIMFLAPALLDAAEVESQVQSRLLNFGKIVMKNEPANFVLVEFVSGRFPETGSDAGVFRDGEKVGAIRFSEQQSRFLTTADIREGVLRIGDEVRPE